MGKRPALGVMTASAIALCVGPACAVNDVGGSLITLTDTTSAPNGAWSWFEDERAIIDDSDPSNTLLLVSSVSAAANGSPESGDIDLLWLNVDTGVRGEFELHDRLERDDHDSAALWVRPDGRYLAMYSKHGTDRLTRWRVSTNPGDPTAWAPEQTLAGTNGSGGQASRGTTYNNVHYLADDRRGQGRLYNFTRSDNLDPNVQVSTDHGSSWSHVGKLLTEGGSGDRPYMRYFSDGNRVHFTATNRHPHDFNNNLYHGYVEDGALYDSFGAVLDSNVFDFSGVGPSALTPIFTAGTVFDGVSMQRAWNSDTAIDASGNPVVVYTARADDDRNDHRFFYATFDGQQWNSHQMAAAGGFLYNSQWDYTGLVSLDPNDTDTVFMSTEIDPRTGAAMSKYEIFRGQTADLGATWSWEPITFNSTVDNLRPLVPEWNADETALVWMRGNYNTFTSWDTEVVVLAEIEPLTDLVSAADLDSDGQVGLSDYEILVTHLHTDLSSLSDAEARARGDLNADARSNFEDFIIFEREYSLFNGQSALTLDLRAAPEPGSVWMMLTMSALGASVISPRASVQCLAAPLLLLLSPCLTEAQITYYDADPASNTTLADGTPLVEGTHYLLDSPTGDDLWDLRSFANGGSVFSSNNNAGENAPALRTTIDGLTPGEGYSVFAYFWGADGGGQGWRGRASLTPPDPIESGQVIDGWNTSHFSTSAFSPMTHLAGSFDPDNPGPATTANDLGIENGGYFSNPPLLLEDDRFLAEAPLGLTIADSNGEIHVYADDLAGTSSRNRTWYDGVGIEPVELDVLTLEVNVLTGAVNLTNNEESAVFNIRYYEIASVSGSLDTVGWTPLDVDPAVVQLDGWQAAGGSDAHLLSEVNLEASLAISPGDRLGLGSAFATPGTEDLEFRYAASDGELRQGFVRYTATAPLVGDYNQDQSVDAADYSFWRDRLGEPGSSLGPNRDLGVTGVVGEADLTAWQANYGRTDGPATAVPEPSCAAVASFAWLAVSPRRSAA